MTTYTILGAGISGLSCSFHLGHEKCLVFEQSGHAGGHVRSHQRDGFVWDEGPHVSFTQHAYVRELFEESVTGELLDYPVQVSNYFRGVWIPHPAQSHLHAVPEPLRTQCLDDFLKVAQSDPASPEPRDYAAWLKRAFGDQFARTFPFQYSRKYWTVEPERLAIDWVGNRVFRPDIETVRTGAVRAQPRSTHYITRVRYPTRGGYIAFARKMLANARLHLDHEVVRVDLKSREISFANGQRHRYERLISTIPLPELVRLADPPADIAEAARTLCCTSVLLVNVTADHVTKRPYHWLYVYDDDILATRISCIELLSPNNAPVGKTGLQVEVYESRHKPFKQAPAEIAKRVCNELVAMGLVESVASVHTKRVEFANVLFDLRRRECQELILGWLEQFGLVREEDDLEPMTKWEAGSGLKPGALALAGRFGQWKYFWTDDCVLRGQALARRLEKT